MSARTNVAKILATASIAFVGFAAQADDLLIVDLSVPNTITINSTTGNSALTVSGPDGTGVYLQNFYSGAGVALTSTLVSGNITNVGFASDGTPALFRGGAGTDAGLNLWSWATATTVTFTGGTQAFTGNGTWTVSAAMFANMTAGGNRTGNLFFPADTADDITAASLLGTYRVIIPAPATLPLLGIGLGFGAMRRRR